MVAEARLEVVHSEAEEWEEEAAAVVGSEGWLAAMAASEARPRARPGAGMAAVATAAVVREVAASEGAAPVVAALAAEERAAAAVAAAAVGVEVRAEEAGVG